MRYKIIEMCGREVAARPLEKEDGYCRGILLTKCADCGQPAQLVITELGPLEDVRTARIWGYCGGCEVGG